KIAVIGLDGRPLGAEAEELLDGAALVAGGERHLQSLGVDPERAGVLKGDLSQALEKIGGASGPVAVLASGDPGFFGIVRLLGERFDPENLRVVPALSSVARAFARAGLPWDDAVTVSAHGRASRRAVNVCRAHPKVAVLTSPSFGPAELAEALHGLGRTFLVAERLGESDERTYKGTDKEVVKMEWEDPNVVVVYDAARAIGGRGTYSGCPEEAGRGPWALPEGEFEHRSAMVTKPETRAVILARLGPGIGDLVWDIGAGSGSVAVECARFGAAAIAVERDAESCARIRRNAARHNVYVQVIEGEAPAALYGLPEPDAVFVGGTGENFEEVVKLAATSARRSVVLSLITLERVVPAGEILTSCELAVEATLLQASRAKSIGALHRLAAETPVFVVSGSKRQ
ncbi:MAG TPA: precorrin-6y C5,15-methyltransferase (decarboxylating) subunit CbiE, partial [Rubrobacteraceae bacterium]|nr:precorrin-6y C5,15-methyltransferase (decarboxylating) subunit CbiE [Rubrobacteraceae bacterium]